MRVQDDFKSKPKLPDFILTTDPKEELDILFKARETNLFDRFY